MANCCWWCFLYLWNCIHTMKTDIIPIDPLNALLSFVDHDLQWLHDFGCLIYVLDPTLQDNKKLQKWRYCSWYGIYLDVCKDNGSNDSLLKSFYYILFYLKRVKQRLLKIILILIWMVLIKIILNLLKKNLIQSFDWCFLVSMLLTLPMLPLWLRIFPFKYPCFLLQHHYLQRELFHINCLKRDLFQFYLNPEGVICTSLPPEQVTTSSYYSPVGLLCWKGLHCTTISMDCLNSISIIYYFFLWTNTQAILSLSNEICWQWSNSKHLKTVT